MTCGPNDKFRNRGIFGICSGEDKKAVDMPGDEIRPAHDKPVDAAEAAD